MASTQSDGNFANDFIVLEKIECSLLFRHLSNQLKEVFVIQSEVEEEVLHSILGEAFMSQAHVHNTTMLEHFVYMIISTSGRHDWGVRALERLVRPEFHHCVNVAIAGLSHYPQSGLIGNAICIASTLQNETMEEIVALLCAGIVRNDMGLFAQFLQSHDNLLSPVQLECLQIVVKDI